MSLHELSPLQRRALEVGAALATSVALILAPTPAVGAEQKAQIPRTESPRELNQHARSIRTQVGEPLVRLFNAKPATDGPHLDKSIEIAGPGLREIHITSHERPTSPAEATGSYDLSAIVKVSSGRRYRLFGRNVVALEFNQAGADGTPMNHLTLAPDGKGFLVTATSRETAGAKTDTSSALTYPGAGELAATSQDLDILGVEMGRVITAAAKGDPVEGMPLAIGATPGLG